ncbi:MAG: isoleucine--tRNA ligase [Synergistaceae bacterium]|nr:isoleucine--tRNA ligase [Synergistaceae bacterium]
MAQDYKETLLLPQTEFPMRANLAQREPEFLKFWQGMDLYGELKKKNSGKPSFILHDGPPYANASIHIGTATNKILKDFIVKYKWLSGYFTPYVPGFDTHGLPTELKVLKEDGVDRDTLTPIDLRKRCEAYARKFIDVQSGQFQRLGVIGDWEHPYMTLLPAYEATELEGLAEMADKGYIYKGNKPIYWCMDCQTALAAAEIEYGDEISPSIYVAYKYQGADKVFPELAGKDVNIIIWTTTPWTLPASRAVALHAHYEYGFYEAAGKIFAFATELKDEVSKATGLEFGEPVIVCEGQKLENTKATHPFYDLELPVVLAPYVTLDTGTGCVHTAPGHGADDYETGIRYGIDVFNSVDDKGCFVKDLPFVGGMPIHDGEKIIFQMLEESGRLLGRLKIKHSYPHCWRCKKPVIFRATPQWFISVSKFKDEALKAIDSVKWVPDWGKDRITNMVRDRSDWCISRQRTWGVPIPAFYCEDCGEVILTGDRIRRVAKKVREHGSNCWWEMSNEDLVGDLAVCPKCGGKHLKKETDILDVWFDSGTSHSAVLDNWSDLSWPADLYLEGSDQHRGWFQTSLLNSVAIRGRAPYGTVLTHGFIMAGDGRKMSKSLGNVMTPEKISDKYGADILRLWVASSDYRSDVRISEEIFKTLTEEYRRIRNTARFLLGNLNGFDPAKNMVPNEQLGDFDKYILLKLDRLRDRVTKGFDAYEFHQPMTLIHQFCDQEMSALYIDINKDGLYTDSENSAARRSIQTTMWKVLKAVTVMMSNVLSFTAEEIWQCLREKDASLPESVFLADWPDADVCGIDPELEQLWDKILDARQAVLRGLESARANNVIGHPLDADVTIAFGEKFTDLSCRLTDEQWRTLLIVSNCKTSAEINGDAYEDEATGIKIAVSKCEFEKCPRCWQRRAEVAENGICDRCREVLGK